MFEMYGSVFNTVYGIVLAFICAFFISVTSTPVVRTLAFKCGVTDIPKDNRRMHKKEMPLMGGAAIFLAFTVTVLIFCKPTVQTIAMLIGNLIIVITGIIDDKYDMNAFVKLFLQIAASVVAVGGGIVFEQINLFGYDIAFGSLAPVVTVLWITAITNAVNFLDLEAVILYGELNVQPDCLFDRLRERVQARSVVSRSHEVAVLASRLGDEDAKTASAAAILNAYYRRQLS